MKLVRESNSDYYYHISHEGNPLHREKDIPFSLYARIDGDNRCEDEPRIKRTCVSPSIIRCLCALTYSRKVYIYRTLKKISPYKAKGVVDSRLTKEKWVLGRCDFIYIGEWNLAELTMEEINTRAGANHHLPAQREFLNFWREYLKRNGIKDIKGLYLVPDMIAKMI